MPVAGKTGTTNNALDCWFVGYTPYYVGATYIGDDARTSIARRSVVGTSGTAAKLWSNVMAPIHENLTVAKFTKPDGVYFAKINTTDGGTSSYGVSAAFVEGTSPSRASSYQFTPPQNTQPEEEEEPTTPEEAGDGDTPPEEEEPATPEETLPSEDNNPSTETPPANNEEPVSDPNDTPVDNTTTTNEDASQEMIESNSDEIIE